MGISITIFLWLIIKSSLITTGGTKISLIFVLATSVGNDICQHNSMALQTQRSGAIYELNHLNYGYYLK